MRVRILPSHFGQPDRLQALTTILVDDRLALDAGSLGLALDARAQRRVRQVLISHEHIDHIGSLPLFVSEMASALEDSLRVYASRTVITSLRRHLFNGVVWPKFHEIELPEGNGTCVEFVEVTPEEPFDLDGLRITPVAMNHVIPTLGFAIDDGKSSFLFSADTYRSDAIWELADRLENLRAILIDVSFPNEMESMARTSKHLTPHSLDLDLQNLQSQAPVLAVHLKPQYRDTIIRQLDELGRPNVSVAQIGRNYEW